MYFRIKKINLTESPQRNASNGVLFFLRYMDKDNLYYAGLRVDGFAVIKKKAGSLEDYHTLATKRIYAGEYDRNNSEKSNLLPLNKWIGIRARVFNLQDGGVHIEFWIDKPKDDREAVGNWEKVIEAEDHGEFGGVYNEEGRSGIRTDFLDGEFHSFQVTNLDACPE